jgi:hypothetical protein
MYKVWLLWLTGLKASRVNKVSPETSQASYIRIFKAQTGNTRM